MCKLPRVVHNIPRKRAIAHDETLTLLASRMRPSVKRVGAVCLVTCTTICVLLSIRLCCYVVVNSDRLRIELGQGGSPWPAPRSMDNAQSERNMNDDLDTPGPVVTPRSSPTALPPEPRLYALSLSFMDQMSWAAARLKSLQCWATTWKSLYKEVHIVEPFVTNGSRLGVPIDVDQTANHSLKFSDIFDIDTWNSNGTRRDMHYPELVSWSNFLNDAPRNVIAVQIVYGRDYRCTENDYTEPTCGSARLNETLSQVLVPYNFTVINQVCINFRKLGTLTVQGFNRRIFDPIPKHTPVTVVFDEWRGPGDKEKKNSIKEKKNNNKCFVRITGAVCTPNSPIGYVRYLSKTLLTPSSMIQDQAEAYISRYLNDTSGYVAVLIRWEKLLLSQFYGTQYWPSTGDKCVKKIIDHVNDFYSKMGLNNVFLTTDIGRFGSSTFNYHNTTRDSIENVTSYTEDLLREFHNETMSLADYEQRFDDIGGMTSPAVISQLHKAIASKARCLVLVGWGTFHENLLQMYKKLYSAEEECHKFIRSC